MRISTEYTRQTLENDGKEKKRGRAENKSILKLSVRGDTHTNEGTKVQSLCETETESSPLEEKSLAWAAARAARGTRLYARAEMEEEREQTARGMTARVKEGLR